MAIFLFLCIATYSLSFYDKLLKIQSEIRYKPNTYHLPWTRNPISSNIDFGEKEESLVKESWEVMKPNIGDLSLRFFIHIFEIAPAAKGMFSFLPDSDEIPQNNPKLKAHALKVFKMTCESAIQLRKKEEVVVPDSSLKHLGSVHLKRGVISPHFEVVKEALLRSIKEAVREKWNDEMASAWGEAYDQLAAAIKKEMNQESATASTLLSN